jgi:hypothetical protein
MGSKKQPDSTLLPDIKDYQRIVERGLERLERADGRRMPKSYDQWCHLVKMCFESEEGSNVVGVGSVELMRLHPVFNKLSYYGVRDFLSVTSLVKLRANQPLYRQADPDDSVYLVIFGKLVLHHKTLGALGVVGMGQTLGEETLIEKTRGTGRYPTQPYLCQKREAVFAQTESYLLHFGEKEWRRLRDIFFRGRTGASSKADYNHLDRLLQSNYDQKMTWRSYKQKSYGDTK